ncbi:MAG: hypothetical protein IAB19_06400 [Proteobacteria bacterium]|uniref:Uncharacterized protein n=1 Tax=Candidatus Avisuccinivibrio stercorigallinarum TaxID=2840704 RepID=A0A9D9DCT0_9GAMM|nr:hypothetical protein [Candidatus Avisuccinivibrio stercorigallinarum]
MPFNPLRTIWQLRPGIKPPFGGTDEAAEAGQVEQAQPAQPAKPAQPEPQVSADHPAASAAAPVLSTEAAPTPEPGGVNHAKLEQDAAQIVQQAKAAEQHRREELVKAQQAAKAKADAQAQAAKAQTAAQPQPVQTAGPACTLYISPGLNTLSYLEGLKAFMHKKGVRIEPFIRGQAVAQPALVLLSPGDLPPAGAMCFVPDENKAALWAFLKQQLPQLAS